MVALPPAGAAPPAGATLIYRTFEESADQLVGFVDEAGLIQRLHWGAARPVGRCDAENHVFRATTHGERELGQALATGAILSVGLFEGGALGWLDPDGVVFQGGLILGEQEVGRVEGHRALAAAAALLLIFLPDESLSGNR